MSLSDELIIVTGTDSGIGLKLAGLFIKDGYTVLATYIGKPSVKNAENIELDLRKEESITAVADKVRKLTEEGRSLACLVNNAGIALGGGIENLPLQLYRENFEVNFFGLISLTQKLLPYIIKSKGKIILHGSAAGKIAPPFLSPYACTKHAIEAYADCLRRELIPYGIKTILLQTGGVATPIWEGFGRQDTSFMDKKFEKTMELFNRNFLHGPKGLSVEQAAEKIMDVFKKKNPRPRAIIAKSVFREYLIRLIPASLLDRIFINMFGMDYGNMTSPRR